MNIRSKLAHITPKSRSFSLKKNKKKTGIKDCGNSHDVAMGAN